MAKLCVLGDSESIKGFGALGLETFICEDEASAEEVFKKVTAEGYGVIFITEHLCLLLEKEIEKADRQIDTNIIPIPGVSKNNGLGTQRLKAAVEKAVGSDIIFNK